MQDPNSRVACETLCTTDFVIISGEVTTKAKVDYEKIAREVIKEIGYTDKNIGFDYETAQIVVKIHEQSADISQGVTEGEGLYIEQGAGDQGMMFGYASDETVEFMPAPILYAHRIVERLAELRKNGDPKYSYLKPDSKSQVSFHYKNGKPDHLESVVVSHQHDATMKIEDLTALVKEVVKEVIPAEFLHEDILYYINPTGKFEIGGPNGDTGLTGRKIIVDTYGGVGSHGGGAFSGKDPSKVDRSAAYMCRYIAKNIVGAKLAHKCEVQVAYAIGVAEPLSINVDTYGTGKLKNDADLEKIIRKVFSLKPKSIIDQLQLKYPGKTWNYSKSARYGHFGRNCFPWEQLDKVAELQEAAKEYC